MRTKEEICDQMIVSSKDEECNTETKLILVPVTTCVEVLVDIRDQLKRIADNMEPQMRFETTHPSTKEIEERIEKITGKFIKLSPKEPNNK